MLNFSPTPNHMDKGEIPGRVVRFDAFEVDLEERELRKAGERVKIQEQPFQILVLLLERPGSVLTREDLQKALWPDGTFVDFEHGLNTAVKRLREALGDSAEVPHFVETVARRGYRFIGAIETINAPAAAAIPSAPPRPSRAPHMRRWLVLGGVAALALLAITYVTTRSRTGEAAKVKSLAVLPLQNLSGDAAQEYFADGMTEAIIGRLSAISGLRVISRTSVMRYKDTQLSAPEIAQALQVDALGEGSVMRDGNRIRVNAQLIRGATDEHFWSEAYDRELRDVLALESEVAQAIARRVEATVTGDERARLVAARSVSPEVYESFLKGQFALEKAYSQAGIEESIGYFEEAIKRDPGFGPVHVGLA